MINVVCVKWGDKYCAQDVNRLRAMVARHLSLPHQFYCYTDNPACVNARIIPIPADNDLTVWWNKLALFQAGFGGLNGRVLYLDLDLVIQHNIDDVVWHHPDGLTCVKAHWKGEQAVNYTNFNMDINSSVMTWNAGDCTAIWDHFAAGKETFLGTYLGMDRFLYHEGFQFKHWPKGWIYSRLNGIDLRCNYYEYKKNIKFEVFLFPSAKICLLNGVWSQAYEARVGSLPLLGLEHYFA